MSPWGWTPKRAEGIWKYGPAGLRPFVAAVPWLTVFLLLMLLHVVGGTLSAAKGTLFELPDAGLGDAESTRFVALLMPMPHETLVFFDDARYTLGEEMSMGALGDHFSDRVAKSRDRSLTVLADRRVATGELMRFAEIARRSGFDRILFAEKREEAAE